MNDIKYIYILFHDKGSIYNNNMEVKTDIITIITQSLIGLLIDFIVFNTTFSNIPAISW